MLGKVEWQWPLAKDLKRFLSLWALDNQAVNSLVELFRKMASYVKNKNTQTNILKAATILEHMKEVELEENVAEQQDIENLLLNL